MADARSGSHHSLLYLALLQTSRGATAQGCGTRAGLTTTKVPSSAEAGDPDPIRQRSSNPAQMRSSQAETCFRRTVGDGLKMSVADRVEDPGHPGKYVRIIFQAEAAPFPRLRSPCSL